MKVLIETITRRKGYKFFENKNDRSYCWQIKNNDRKQACLAKIK